MEGAKREVVVQVKDDHLSNLTSSSSPAAALGELVWNALDADARNVDVNFAFNDLDCLSEIYVKDDGQGIDASEAEKYFGSLGGSWKASTRATRKEGRLLHGKLGQGRFKAYSVGNRVQWDTTFSKDDSCYQYQIDGHDIDIKKFLISEPVKVDGAGTGTTVTVSNLCSSKKLDIDKIRKGFIEEFAIYSKNYQEIKISVDNILIDFNEMIEEQKEFILDDIEYEGNTYQSKLVVIRWLVNIERSLYLCSKSGFCLKKENVGIRAPGHSFTAYIKSGYFDKLKEDSALEGMALYEGYNAIAKNARGCMKDYLREVSASQVKSLVEEWKEQDIYPYKGDHVSDIDKTERQVFDICALNVNAYLPGFGGSDDAAKKFSFALLKTAIKENPKALKRILNDVLELPQDRQNDLAELLEKTSLGSIVNAAKVVADRLDFMKGLELLLFDPENKKVVLERTQLHKILAEHTWLFGEQYNLSASDNSLTKVLERHLQHLGEERKTLAPVKRLDGSTGIVDMMLSKAIPQPNAHKKEHLIVELKRPSVRAGIGEVNQIKSYGFAVQNDERFRGTDTVWHFFLVVNEMDSFAEKESTQKDRPRGMLYEDPDGRSFIWIKTWAEVLHETCARLEFYQKQIQYNATETDGLEYLKKTHEKYIPDTLKNQKEPVKVEEG